MKEFSLRMLNINKQFDGVSVLKNISLELYPGEIHALLGENGAGKSTLMNILGGVISADSGTIEINGEEVIIQNPSESQKKGVAFIHQELNVVNNLKVYENMFLGYEILGKYGKLDVNEMVKRCNEVFNFMNIFVDPNTMVGELDASYKQIIEIAKALLRNASILIMDEPTTSLTHKEIQNVFAIMRTLKSKGTTIIFISHKLGEVVEICDRFTVLRNGEKIIVDEINGPNGTISAEAIARYMVGREIESDIYQPHEFGEVVLEVDKLCCEPYFRDISFTVKRGEILVFTGLLGDGRTELARALFGDIKTCSGTVVLNGDKILRLTPEKALNKKIGFVPDNRKENGIIKDLTVLENLTISTLKGFRKLLGLDHKEEQRVTRQYVESLRIKAHSHDSYITSLSGGNQQKVVLGRWLHVKPDMIILANPTQGVDVGAKQEIYSLIMKLAQSGVAVIVMTGESQEALKVCDRVCVMYHGAIRAELDRSECSEEAIMILSTGGSIN